LSQVGCVSLSRHKSPVSRRNSGLQIWHFSNTQNRDRRNTPCDTVARRVIRSGKIRSRESIAGAQSNGVLRRRDDSSARKSV
jgi:hypothetical protein